MKLSTIFTFALTTFLTGVQATFTWADSPTPPATESQSVNASLRNNGGTESSIHAAVSQEKAPDCEGQIPFNGVVTALLSRIVRSPGNTQGKQCPIPPVPDHRSSQELHE